MTEKQWNGAILVVDDSGSMTTLSGTPVPERDYLLKANNLSDIPNRNIARENLGITVSALPPVNPKINDLWLDLNS